MSSTSNSSANSSGVADDAYLPHMNVTVVDRPDSEIGSDLSGSEVRLCVRNEA